VTERLSLSLRGYRLSPALIAVAVALGSRLLLLVAGTLSGWYVTVLGVERFLHYRSGRTVAFALAHPLPGWAHWDGRWFILIVHFGYSVPYSPAFYPLYPGLIWVANHATGDPLPSGLLVSWVCFVCAAYLLYRLVTEDFGPRIGVLAVVFLSIAPTSFFFQAVYSESLFLLLVLASFRCAQKRLWFLAGTMGLLACLTRATGVVLIVPLAMLYMQSREWRWRGIRADVVAVALPLGGIGLYALYLGRVFGDPLLMIHAERHWHRHFSDPLVTIWKGALDGVRGTLFLITGHGVRAPAGLHDVGLWTGLTPWGNALAFAALLVVMALIALGWRRLPPAYTAYAIAAIVVPLMSPTVSQPLKSLPRFALVVFPLFITVALVTDRRPWLRWTIIALSCIALLVLTGLFMVGEWVA
jgi:hypothetical protein